MMRHYCTYFDQAYLARGLTLYDSLRALGEPFTLWVLCLDAVTERVLHALAGPEVRCVPLAALEAADPALPATKATRSPIEYYFTCSAAWPGYLLAQVPTLDAITYLDADLYLYASPAPIYAELDDGAILIIGHRFPEHLRGLEVYGRYNVGLLVFRNEARSRACLAWWREQCLAWCFDRVEDGRYADQKYLDEWPTRFPGTVVLKNPAAGLAPWNWMNYSLAVAQGKLLVEGQPLIFYHFQGLKLLNRWWYDPGVAPYGGMPRWLLRWLYDPYVAALKRNARAAAAVVPGVTPGYLWQRVARPSPVDLLKKLLKGQLRFHWEGGR